MSQPTLFDRVTPAPLWTPVARTRDPETSPIEKSEHWQGQALQALRAGESDATVTGLREGA